MDPILPLLAAEEAGGIVPPGFGKTAAVVLAAGAVIVALLSLAASRVFRAHGRAGAGAVLFGGMAWFPALAVYGLLVAWSGSPPGDRAAATAMVFVSFLVVGGTWLAATFFDFLLFSPGREFLGWKPPVILRETVRALLMVAAVFFVLLSVWGVHFGDVAVLASALAVVLGIALGPTLGSLVAGITLTSERPFEIGDWVEVEGKQGRVEQVTWRSTRIITRDNECVVLPNSKLATERILNFSRHDRRLGVRCRVPVHYRTPPLQAVEAIRAAVQGTPRILKWPDAVIRLVEYGENAVVWEIRFWIDDPAPVEDIRSDFMQRVWYALQRAGVEIPLPSRNLLMRDHGWDGQPGLGESEERERRRRNVELLRKVPIFQPLPEKSLEFLAAQARDEVFLEGERVAKQGEPGDRMFVIVSGSARVALDAEATQEVGILGPEDFFGEMSVLTGAPRSASVRAMGDLRLVSLRARDLAPVLQDQPDFARHLAEHAAKRKVGLEDLVAKAQATSSARELETSSLHLLKEIVRFFKLPGSKGEGGGPAHP